MNWSDKVRRSCAKVMEQSQLVQIVPEKLHEFAATLTLEQLRHWYTWNVPFHFQGEKEILLNYVFTNNALNFGSGFAHDWQRQRLGTYIDMASRFSALASSGESLSPVWASQMTVKEMASLFEVSPSFPLMTLYTESLRSLGIWVAESYGSYQALLDSLQSNTPAQELIGLLVQVLPYYQDMVVHQGEEVWFLKRVQILLSDLSLAGCANFNDLTSLTMFSDNLVPHVLWKNGVLSYDAPLVELIQRGRELWYGSPEEVELRAAAVVAVELLTSCIQDRYPKENIFPALIDCTLWNMGQSPEYKKYPRHLTKCVFY